MAYKNTIIKDNFFESTWCHRGELPEALKSVSVDVFEKILHIAADTIFQFQQADTQEKLAQLVKATSDKLGEEKTSELAALRKGYETSLAKLRADLEAATLFSESLSSKVKTMESDLHKKFMGDLRVLKEEKESQYQNEIRRLQEQHREMITMMQTALEKQYKGQMEIEKEMLAKEWAKLEEVKATLATRGSSNKGQEGEDWFEQLVKAKTSWDPLVNTSKEAHATDRSGRIGKCAVLFEIKNYSNTVPSKEVVKFQRDMEEHRDVPFGVFISKNTNITGMRGFLKTEWTKSGQLLLFIANMDSHVPEDLLSYIETCSACAFRIYCLQSDLENTKEESATIHEMSMRFDKAKIYVERELKRVADLGLSMTNDKKLLLSTIENNYNKYALQMKEAKGNLQDTLDILLNKISESDGEGTAVVAEKKEKKKREPREKKIKATE